MIEIDPRSVHPPLSEHEQMLERRRAAVRTLVDDVVRGFIALDDAGRRDVARRLDDHFSKLHPAGPRWRLVAEAGQ